MHPPGFHSRRRHGTAGCTSTIWSIFHLSMSKSKWWVPFGQRFLNLIIIGSWDGCVVNDLWFIGGWRRRWSGSWTKCETRYGFGVSCCSRNSEPIFIIQSSIIAHGDHFRRFLLSLLSWWWWHSTLTFKRKSKTSSTTLLVSRGCHFLLIDPISLTWRRWSRNPWDIIQWSHWVSDLCGWCATYSWSIYQGLPRRVAQDDVYKGYFIPKDTIVFSNSWYAVTAFSIHPFSLSLSRAVAYEPNEKYDPHKFFPDRFLDKTQNVVDPHSYYFGYGRRYVFLSIDILEASNPFSHVKQNLSRSGFSGRCDLHSRYKHLLRIWDICTRWRSDHPRVWH